MRGEIGLITYERAGIPVELRNERDWRRAICRGHLCRATVVLVYRDSTLPSHQQAEQVVELRSLFDELDPVGDASTPVAVDPAQASPVPAPEYDGEPYFPAEYSEHVEHSDDFGDPETGDVGIGDQDWRPESQRRPAIVTLGILLLFVAGLATVMGIGEGSDPEAIDSGQERRVYRVVESANLRRGPAVNAARVRTLRRDLMLTGTLVQDDTRQSWLRIAEGEHAGLFIWAGNLEPVAVPDDARANIN